MGNASVSGRIPPKTTVCILVHSLNGLSLCTKMAAVAVAKLLLCRDIICKCSIRMQGSEVWSCTPWVGLRDKNVDGVPGGGGGGGGHA